MVAVAVISTANLSSFFGEYGNSLEFLTKEFVTEIDEPVLWQVKSRVRIRGR